MSIQNVGDDSSLQLPFFVTLNNTFSFMGLCFSLSKWIENQVQVGYFPPALDVSSEC